MRDAVSRLPEKQRATLILKVYHDLTHEEVAGILGSSVGHREGEPVPRPGEPEEADGGGARGVAMTGHLSDDTLLDVLEGTAACAERAHLETCAECARASCEAKAALLRRADADVPEPSPLYWDRSAGRSAAASRKSAPVGASVAAAPWRRRRPGSLFVVPLFAGPAPARLRPPAPVLPLVGAPAGRGGRGPRLVAEAGLVETDLAAVGEMKGVDECLADLTDDEARALGSARWASRPAEEAL